MVNAHILVIDHPGGRQVSRAIGLALESCSGRYAGMITLDARRVLDPYAVERAVEAEPDVLVIVGAQHDHGPLWHRLHTLAIQPTWTINLRSTPTKRISAPRMIVTTDGDVDSVFRMPVTTWKVIDLRSQVGDQP